MVTYEYRCESCGKEFEQQEHISEHASAPAHCPDCDSEKVEQLHSAVYVKTSKKS
jgi:putative FmdB family regulatory protein